MNSVINEIHSPYSVPNLNYQNCQNSSFDQRTFVSICWSESNPEDFVIGKGLFPSGTLYVVLKGHIFYVFPQVRWQNSVLMNDLKINEIATFL